MNFWALLLGEWVFKPHSLVIKMILRVRGVRVGKNFKILGMPQLRLLGGRNSIVIGDNVFIKGCIDLRTRENGKIVIHNNVAIDTNCRLIAANDAVLEIKEGADLGCNLICNCGTDVTIGRDVLMGGYCHIQSSSHGILAGQSIKAQPQVYAPVSLSEGSWIGGNVTILCGVTIGRGAVIGAKSVVTKDVESNAIVAGVPAKVIKMRI